MSDNPRDKPMAIGVFPNEAQQAFEAMQEQLAEANNKVTLLEIRLNDEHEKIDRLNEQLEASRNTITRLRKEVDVWRTRMGRKRI